MDSAPPLRRFPVKVVKPTGNKLVIKFYWRQIIGLLRGPVLELELVGKRSVDSESGVGEEEGDSAVNHVIYWRTNWVSNAALTSPCLYSPYKQGLRRICLRPCEMGHLLPGVIPLLVLRHEVPIC